MTSEPIKTSAESTRHESTKLTETQGKLNQASQENPFDQQPVEQEANKQFESNYTKLLKEYNDLAEGYETLKKHLEEETKFHQEQTSQNAAIMVDMQDTISKLQSQLDDVLQGRSSRVSQTFFQIFGKGYIVYSL